MRLIAAALCVLILAGCAVRQPHGKVTLKGDEAMIVLSTRVDDRCDASVLMVLMGMEMLRERDNNLRAYALQLTNTFLKSDFQDPPGMLYHVKIHAGDLRFTKLSRTSTRAGFASERELGFRMRIEPGKVYYLGEVYVELGCRDFNIRVSDQRLRDGALFDERMTTLNSSMFEYRPLGTE